MRIGGISWVFIASNYTFTDCACTLNLILWKQGRFGVLRDGVLIKLATYCIQETFAPVLYSPFLPSLSADEFEIGRIPMSLTISLKTQMCLG